MTEKPSPEEVVRWQRRLAGQANNRAWSLSEQASRSAAEDEEMLKGAMPTEMAPSATAQPRIGNDARPYVPSMAQIAPTTPAIPDAWADPRGFRNRSRSARVPARNGAARAG